MADIGEVLHGTTVATNAILEQKGARVGLVTTKGPREETVAGLTGRVRDAARHFPIEQLGVSPQCGFATSVIGNAIGLDDQRRKLRIVAETAQALWPA